jgi:hypothetical protein
MWSPKCGPRSATSSPHPPRAAPLNVGAALCCPASLPFAAPRLILPIHASLSSAPAPRPRLRRFSEPGHFPISGARSPPSFSPGQGRGRDRGMFGILVIFGHSAISPGTKTFSDGRPVQLHACKNSMLYHRLTEPFSDTSLCTYQAAWRVKANLDHHASGCFSWAYIFSSVL